MKNSDFPLYVQIMNISVNMGRVGGWVADSYEEKKDLVYKIVDETTQFLTELPAQKISEDFKPTLKKFTSQFERLRKEVITDENRINWAERALTWANILQHRAKLA